MYKSIKISLSFFALVLMGGIASAQDPTFSQFYSPTMFLNPAMAADGQDFNVNVSNRYFTNSSFAEYNLAQVTGNYQFKIQPRVYGRRNKFDQNSGVSLTMFQESLGKGKMNTSGLFATLAHSVQVSKAHYLALGLQIGFAQKALNGDFNWGSEYVPGVGFDEELEGYIENEEDKTYLNMSTGLMWFYNSSRLKSYMRKHNFDAFVGVSAYNLNQPNISLSDTKAQLPINLKVNGGLKFAVHKQVHIFPNFVYMRQNGNNHLNLGTYSSIKTKSAVYAKKAKFSLIAGIWYRLNDAVVPLLGAGVHDFKLLVSYDINASKFAYQNRGKGAMEITLKYTLPQSKEKYQRGLLYPSF